jgi:hypothetical protein
LYLKLRPGTPFQFSQIPSSHVTPSFNSVQSQPLAASLHNKNVRV